jgi:segregation and condensation protein A
MAYNVKLDVFEGPLDLLLHLIKENQVDIYDIPIATVTEQYLHYLDVMKSLNLDVAGDFLVMAATLLYIKSKMLLPKVETAGDEDDPEEGMDPRDELVQKLVEYKKFKEAAVRFREMEINQSQVFTRTPSETDMPKDGDLLVEVSVFELLASLKRTLERFGGDVSKFTVTLEEMSVTDKLNEIMARLESAEFLTFDSLFGSSRSRGEVVATFLALLELMRLKLVRSHQARVGGEIVIYRVPDDVSGLDRDNNETVAGETGPVNGA